MDFSSLNNTFGPNALPTLMGSIFPNSGDAGMDYMNQIKGDIQPLYQPYMDAGTQALPALQTQYSNLMQNPGAMMQHFGQGFQQSPGYQFQVNQAMGAANRAASAGGMLGSPQEQQQVGSAVNGIANQDYYNYLNHVMNMYGQGLSGEQGMAKMGQDATNNYADNLTSSLMSQAQLAYAGQNNQNQMMGGMMGGLANAGMMAAFM